MYRFIRIGLFEKDVKRLKRFLSLQKDIETFENVARVFPQGTGSKHWNCIYKNEQYAVYKVRLACASLKGEAKMRLIYGYHFEKKHFDLVELYWKGEKENHDEVRLRDYMQYQE